MLAIAENLFIGPSSSLTQPAKPAHRDLTPIESSTYLAKLQALNFEDIVPQEPISQRPWGNGVYGVAGVDPKYYDQIAQLASDNGQVDRYSRLMAGLGDVMAQAAEAMGASEFTCDTGNRNFGGRGRLDPRLPITGHDHISFGLQEGGNIGLKVVEIDGVPYICESGWLADRPGSADEIVGKITDPRTGIVQIVQYPESVIADRLRAGAQVLGRVFAIRKEIFGPTEETDNGLQDLRGRVNGRGKWLLESRGGNVYPDRRGPATLEIDLLEV